MIIIGVVIISKELSVMSKPINHFLAGCSFTDPTWQDAVPWSIYYSKQHASYICAKAGMGIKGICTETLYYIDQIPDVIKTLIIVIPTLWRYDVEVDVETYLCNSMVDLLTCNDQGWKRHYHANRKWLTSGGLHYKKNTEMAPMFDFMYKHQGNLVIAKEHFRALERLIVYCKEHKIKYLISAIKDPLDQLVGMDYIRSEIELVLEKVEYDRWVRFEGLFIDKFLKHDNHPSSEEHHVLFNHIIAALES